MSRLREIRKEKGLTIEEVARKAGLTLTGYRNIEIGEADPKLTSAKAIASALGVAIEEIWPAQPHTEAHAANNA